MLSDAYSYPKLRPNERYRTREVILSDEESEPFAIHWSVLAAFVSTILSTPLPKDLRCHPMQVLCPGSFPQFGLIPVFAQDSKGGSANVTEVNRLRWLTISHGGKVDGGLSFVTLGANHRSQQYVRTRRRCKDVRIGTGAQSWC